MERADVVRRITEFLMETYPHEGDELTPSTDLLNDWFVDSLGVVVLASFLEESFGVDMQGSDVNAENFKSVDALASFVLKRRPRR